MATLEAAHSMLTILLANIATDLRTGRDVQTERRRAVCLGTDGSGVRCPEARSVLEGGRVTCKLCRCEDPARDRPRCPAFKW